MTLHIVQVCTARHEHRSFDTMGYNRSRREGIHQSRPTSLRSLKNNGRTISVR